MQLLQDNALICDAPPVYGPQGGGYITQLGTCANMSAEVNIGDTLQNVVVYDNKGSISNGLAFGIFVCYAYVTDVESSTSKDSSHSDEKDECDNNSWNLEREIGLALASVLVILSLFIIILLVVLLIKVHRFTSHKVRYDPVFNT